MTHGDRRQVGVGDQLVIAEKELRFAEHGFHASRRPFDALRHAPGPMLCRVEMSGRVMDGTSDIVVASQRRILAMADVSVMLHRFALQIAWRVVQRHPTVVDQRWQEALRLKEGWLDGEIPEQRVLDVWGQVWQDGASSDDDVEAGVAMTVAAALCPRQIYLSAWQACEEAVQAAVARQRLHIQRPGEPCKAAQIRKLTIQEMEAYSDLFDQLLGCTLPDGSAWPDGCQASCS